MIAVPIPKIRAISITSPHLRVAVVFALFGCAVLFLVQGILAFHLAFMTAASTDIERDIKEQETAIAELESQYFYEKSALTRARAYEEGFTDPKETLYVTRDIAPQFSFLR